MKNISLTALFLLIFANTSFAQVGDDQLKLDLSEERMNAGGRLAFPMKINRHDEFHFAFDFSPSFGLFIRDRLEFRAEINTNADWVFSKPKAQVSPPFFWGASSYFIYYFKTNHIVKPYIGGGLGFSLFDWNIFGFRMLAHLPVGILLELNDSFALDISMPIKLRISVRSLMETLEFPLAFLGIRYFFG